MSSQRSGSNLLVNALAGLEAKLVKTLSQTSSTNTAGKLRESSLPIPRTASVNDVFCVQHEVDSIEDHEHLGTFCLGFEVLRWHPAAAAFLAEFQLGTCEDDGLAGNQTTRHKQRHIDEFFADSQTSQLSVSEKDHCQRGCGRCRGRPGEKILDTMRSVPSAKRFVVTVCREAYRWVYRRTPPADPVHASRQRFPQSLRSDKDWMRTLKSPDRGDRVIRTRQKRERKKHWIMTSEDKPGKSEGINTRWEAPGQRKQHADALARATLFVLSLSTSTFGPAVA